VRTFFGELAQMHVGLSLLFFLPPAPSPLGLYWLAFQGRWICFYGIKPKPEHGDI
jgi:hypothetical protein